MGKHAYLHFIYKDPDDPASRPESPTAGKDFRVDGINYTFEFDGYLQQLRQAGAGSKGSRTSSRDQRFRSFSDIPSKDDLIWRALVKREQRAEAQRARHPPQMCGTLLRRLLKRKERHSSTTEGGRAYSSSSIDIDSRGHRRSRRRSKSSEDLPDEGAHENSVPEGPPVPLTSAVLVFHLQDT
ncbi:uncharacterized protein LOC143038592 isoform X2 [Oratosquilla oratoria]|uniref:uncharacterized protein LOC143038592 isoform X2 n=1 Tax=Oratosquilla oratoria TaxID=337810 RepID=UPI003F7675E7